MVPLRGLTWSGTAYVVAMVLLGAIIVPAGLLLHPIDGRLLPTFLYLAAFTQVSALMPLRSKHGLQTLDGLPLIAVGLVAPGGVGLIAWLFAFDGRRPSAAFPLWRLFASRASLALGYGLPALVVADLPLPGYLDVPMKSLLMGALSILITFPLTAKAFSYLVGEGFWSLLAANAGLASVRSMAILAVGGGALALLLRLPQGFLMGSFFLAMLLAVRSNMADAQRQETERVQTLELLAQALDARDPLTEMHSQRVSELAAQLGDALEMSPREIESLRVAGLLHDIGKIGVRDSILKKADRLNPDEWEEMKSHAQRGADMVARHTALAPMAPWVHFHHERMDGSGYPEGREGAQIPLGARILAVADSFDTVTGARVYRASTMTPREAVLDISRLSGRWYDPVVVNALRSLHHMPPLKMTQPEISGEPAEARSGLRLIARRPRFAWLASGMTISSFGDPLTSVAIVVTAYAITHNPLMVAATYALKGVATIVAAALLGGASDSWDRRRLMVSTDVARAATLLAAPLLIHLWLWSLFGVVAVLAGAEAMGQSAREAAMPELVRKGEVARANAVIGTLVLAASAAGYPIAAGVLWIANSVTPLLLIDAATFACAALLSLAVGNAGGGVSGRRMTGAFRVAWNVAAARWGLGIATAAAFFMSMLPPTLVVLAYHLSHQGARDYPLLALVTTIGQVSGSLLMTRGRFLSPVRAIVVGLGLMAVLSLAISLSAWIILTAILLFIASAGNSLYVIGNRSELQEASVSDHRGSVMVTRFVLTQCAMVAGAALSGLIAGQFGPSGVFIVLGGGLLALAFVAWQHYLRAPVGSNIAESALASLPATD